MFFLFCWKNRLTSLSFTHWLSSLQSIYFWISILNTVRRISYQKISFLFVCIGKKSKANCTLITMDRCFVFCLQDNIILFVVFFAVCWSASHIERVNFWKFSPYTHLHNWKAIFSRKFFNCLHYFHILNIYKICLFVFVNY